VRWPQAVRAGDALRARSETLSKRASRSQPGRGVVECRYTLLNQRNEVVFTCRSINLIEARHQATQP
jgi:itaconyl-CoA hydratase